MRDLGAKAVALTAALLLVVGGLAVVIFLAALAGGSYPPNPCRE